VATTPKAPAASGVGFAVQLGAFGQPPMPTRCATRPCGRLQCVRRAGRTDKGPLNRVRVGPVANRDGREAQGVRRRQARRQRHGAPASVTDAPTPDAGAAA
jgi:cell division septation protein DedD